MLNWLAMRLAAAILVLGAVPAGIADPAIAQNARDACAKGDATQERCLSFLDQVLLKAARQFANRRDSMEGAAGPVSNITAQARFEMYMVAQCEAEAQAAKPASRETCQQRLVMDRIRELATPDIVVDASAEWSDLRNHRSVGVHIHALEMLTTHEDWGGWPIYSRTLADRAMLFHSPAAARQWSSYKSGVIEAGLFQQLRDRGFGPRSARFITRAFDAFRFNPETGERMLPPPDARKFDPSNGADETARSFASSLPDCLRDLSEPACNIRYSMELGCRLDDELAAICNRRLDILRASFASYDSASAEQTDQFYSALACIGEAGVIDRLTPSFTDNPDWRPVGFELDAMMEGPLGREAGDCRDLGFAGGPDNWTASNVAVFGKPMDLRIGPD